LVFIVNYIATNLPELVNNKLIQILTEHNRSLAKLSSPDIVVLKTDINKLEINILTSIYEPVNDDQVVPVSDLAELFFKRLNYAKLINNTSYFVYKSHNIIDLDTLKNILKDIIDNTHNLYYTELTNNIKEHNTNTNTNTISVPDLRSHFVNKINKYFFDIRHILPILFSLLKTYFNLEFILDSVVQPCGKFQFYSIYYNKKLAGSLIINLYARSTLNKPILITVRPSIIYPVNSNNKQIPLFALQGNYPKKRLNRNNKLTHKSINFLDIIDIFKALAELIPSIFCTYPKYYIPLNPESDKELDSDHTSHFMASSSSSSSVSYLSSLSSLRLFMRSLTELIITDAKNIALLSKYSNKIRKILYSNYYFNMKYSCITILFDLYGHGTRSQKPNNKTSRIISNKFLDISNIILDKSAKLCPIDLSNTIINDLVFDGGLLYNNLINKIIASNIYEFINKHNKFYEFINFVTDTPDKLFIDKLTQFCDKYSINKYNTQYYINIGKPKLVPEQDPITCSANSQPSISSTQIINEIPQTNLASYKTSSNPPNPPNPVKTRTHINTKHISEMDNYFTEN
jgi:hypothetical protein